MGGTPLSLFSPGVHARARYSSAHNRNRKPATANRQRKLWRLFPPFLCVYICVWKRASVTQEPRTALRSRLPGAREGACKPCMYSVCILILNKHPRQVHIANPKNALLAVGLLSVGAIHPDSKNKSVVSFTPSRIPLPNPKCIHWNTLHHHQLVNTVVLTVWFFSKWNALISSIEF